MMNYKVMVLGEYMVIMAGTTTWWYWVSISLYCFWYFLVKGHFRAFMPVYIDEKIQLGVTDAGQTHTRTDRHKYKGLLSLSKIQSLRWGTQ